MKYEYKVFTNYNPNSVTYSVVDYYTSDRVSGGPTIAVFHNEILAIEYVDFKNKQRDELRTTV